MKEKRRRRWLRFSLRTAFVLLAVLAMPSAWTAYSLHWIAQRHAVLDRKDIGVVRNHFSPRLSAPRVLWLLGETGIQSFHVSAPLYLPAEVDRIKLLFPEATVEYVLLPVGPS